VSRRKVIIDGQEVDFTVVQTDPTKLKATVAPSGDMARKAYYDRNASIFVKAYEAAVGPHDWTERWRYTVPSNKKTFHSVLYGQVAISVATSGKFASVLHAISIDGGASFQRFGFRRLSYGDGENIDHTVAASFVLFAGNIVRLSTYNSDTVTHWMAGSSVLSEFDA